MGEFIAADQAPAAAEAILVQAGEEIFYETLTKAEDLGPRILCTTERADEPTEGGRKG